MSDEPRLKRPALDRKEPIRSFASFFSPPAPPSADAAPPDPAAAGDANDPVSSAVNLGYRVVDDYIRQGQRAARRTSDPFLRAGALGNDMQDMGARMFQYASDFAGAWFELWGAGATGEVGRAPFPFAPWAARAPAGEPAAPPEPAASDPAPARAGAPAPAPERTRIAVEVSSVRPAIVTVDLRAGAAERPLVVHELRALSPELPRISDVAFVAGRFRVRVPDGHPAGVYSGAVIDLETSVPAGTVCVTLE